MLHREFWPATFPVKSYEDAWKRWGLKKKPANFEQQFQERYGLHKAPYKNAKYPMGLRSASKGRGIALDCLMCHSGSIAGKSYVGLPNTSLEYQALIDELTPPGQPKANFGIKQLTLVRGTSQVAPATIASFSMRNIDMTVRKNRSIYRCQR